MCGNEPLIDVAIELEKAALADDFFVKRKLYPNVDFYSGLIYKAMGFPTDMFPVLFGMLVNERRFYCESKLITYNQLILSSCSHSPYCWMACPLERVIRG